MLVQLLYSCNYLHNYSNKDNDEFYHMTLPDLKKSTNACKHTHTHTHTHTNTHTYMYIWDTGCLLTILLYTDMRNTATLHVPHTVTRRYPTVTLMIHRNDNMYDVIPDHQSSHMYIKGQCQE